MASWTRAIRETPIAVTGTVDVTNKVTGSLLLTKECFGMGFCCYANGTDTIDKFLGTEGLRQGGRGISGAVVRNGRFGKPQRQAGVGFATKG